MSIKGVFELGSEFIDCWDRLVDGRWNRSSPLGSGVGRLREHESSGSVAGKLWSFENGPITGRNGNDILAKRVRQGLTGKLSILL